MDTHWYELKTPYNSTFAKFIICALNSTPSLSRETLAFISKKIPTKISFMTTFRKVALILICHFIFFCLIGYEEILRYINHGSFLEKLWPYRHLNYNFYFGFYLMTLVFIFLPICTIIIFRNWWKERKVERKSPNNL
jgi:hypothetical protein